MCEAERHDAVTKGYFENEEATKELIDEVSPLRSYSLDIV
jgi:hypothetical protein